MRQQLDSFDEFIQNTIQEIVDEHREFQIIQQGQYSGAKGDVTVLSKHALILFPYFYIDIYG